MMPRTSFEPQLSRSDEDNNSLESQSQRDGRQLESRPAGPRRYERRTANSSGSYVWLPALLGEVVCLSTVVPGSVSGARVTRLV
jgi:hypothetical protein